MNLPVPKLAFAHVSLCALLACRPLCRWCCGRGCCGLISTAAPTGAACGPCWSTWRRGTASSCTAARRWGESIPWVCGWWGGRGRKQLPGCDACVLGSGLPFIRPTICQLPRARSRSHRAVFMHALTLTVLRSCMRSRSLCYAVLCCAAQATTALQGWLQQELAGLQAQVFAPREGESVDIPAEPSYRQGQLQCTLCFHWPTRSGPSGLHAHCASSVNAVPCLQCTARWRPCTPTVLHATNIVALVWCRVALSKRR